MTSYSVFLLLAAMVVIASVVACAPNRAGDPYSQMVSPNAQFGAAGGGGGGGAGGM